MEPPKPYFDPSRAQARGALPGNRHNIIRRAVKPGRSERGYKARYSAAQCCSTWIALGAPAQQAAK
jgi:hypothetical protein